MLWNFMTTSRLIIDETSHDQRLDRFLRKYFKAYPQIKLSDIYSAIRKGDILVNQKKTKEEYRVKDGDAISFSEYLIKKIWTAISPDLKKERSPHDADPEIAKKMTIYQDNNWIVFNKPCWISIHDADRWSWQVNMQDYLRAYIKTNDPTFKPSFWYRLDKETSWILIGAKTYDALQYINKIIRDREVDKYYLTLVVGKFPRHLTINKSLTKWFDQKTKRWITVVSAESDDGKDSLTEWWNQETFNHPLLWQLSLVKVKIETGRMHQIRVHLAHEGFPVLGDMLYGNAKSNRLLFKDLKIKKQFLHCWKYSFFDMFANKTREFSVEAPDYFNQLMKNK